MVSVVIPARNERFLKPTILDVLKNAKGDIEVIAVLDGYWPDKSEIVEDKRVRYLHKGTSEGMRLAINSAVAIARGEYILKLDGHCMVDKGFDVKLVADCKPNWMVIPRRKRLDAEKWEVQPQPPSKPDVDYEYLSYPDDPADWGGPGLNGRIWTEKILEKQNILLDDTCAAQGSAWFMPRQLFIDLKLLDHENWGPFWSENQEQVFSVVLRGGGEVKVNKKTWYAHLHKGKKYGRGYRLEESALVKGRTQAMRFFKGEKVWEDQKYPLSYLIEKFMPMPTWDAEKLEQLKERERKYGWKV